MEKISDGKKEFRSIFFTIFFLSYFSSLLFSMSTLLRNEFRLSDSSRGQKFQFLKRGKSLKVIKDFLEVILSVNGFESEAKTEIKFINFEDNVV